METPIPSTIKTRFLILSDTHGHELPEECSQHHADVVIHCGDLTDCSYLTEFQTTIQQLQRLDAPLKLVIPGNHDFTLDTATFQQKVKASGLDASDHDRRLVRQVYGDYEEVRRKLFTDDLQQSSGITLLDEGIHVFTLANGARLTVYASPYTPSLGGDWGFQYHPDTGHDYQLGSSSSSSDPIDVVITHGPPRGIMDYTTSSSDTHSGRGRRAGCPGLFTAIARARPRLHCFGHIHEGWGAMIAQWRDVRRSHRDQEQDGMGNSTAVNAPSHFTAIDYGRSTVISKLARLVESGKGKGKVPAVMEASHCSEDPAPLTPGEHTLFVNAAVEGCRPEVPVHPLWLMDLELSRAGAMC